MPDSTTRSRIFYVAPVAVEARAQETDIPALRNKVLGVCAAIRMAGGRPVVVSALSNSRDIGFTRPARLGRIGRIPAVRAFSRSRAGIKRVVSAFSLLIVIATVARRTDRVLLYNFFPEYFLLAAWCWLIRNPAIIDIEDAPRRDEPGLRGLMTRVSFRWLRPLCADRSLIVSERLAHNLKLDHFLTVYGVSSHFDGRADPELRFRGESLRIGYGGSLTRETGADLLCSALGLLVRYNSDKPLHFFITGKDVPSAFDEWAAVTAQSTGIRVHVLRHLSMDEYRTLAASFDVGLCLKLPTEEMGLTTFPSKVIEVAANGSLLCTTAVSDVPLIFDSRTAAILKGETPEELVDQLIAINDDRDSSRRRAVAGRALVEQRFSSVTVGTAIRDFLEA